MSGVIRHPAWPEGLEANRAGGLSALPGCGGITYDIKAGDSAYGWAADHLEPGASTHNPDEKERMCYYTVCCMGNKAEVIGGNAEGAEGYVVAKHAGAWHVVIEFDQRDLREMHIKDQVQVVAYGTGLKLLDYPDVHVNSIDPECLEAMDIEEKDGKLHVPVAGVVPAVLMGSGMGSSRPMGDVDFMTSDWAVSYTHLQGALTPTGKAMTRHTLLTRIFSINLLHLLETSRLGPIWPRIGQFRKTV